jgi:hypothetical protein
MAANETDMEDIIEEGVQFIRKRAWRQADAHVMFLTHVYPSLLPPRWAVDFDMSFELTAAVHVSKIHGNKDKPDEPPTLEWFTDILVGILLKTGGAQKFKFDEQSLFESSLVRCVFSKINGEERPSKVDEVFQAEAEQKNSVPSCGTWGWTQWGPPTIEDVD